MSFLQLRIICIHVVSRYLKIFEQLAHNLLIKIGRCWSADCVNAGDHWLQGINIQNLMQITELISFLLVKQCRIIRTTELATANEKLNELEKQKEEMLKMNSPASLLQRIQGMTWTYTIYCNSSGGNNFFTITTKARSYIWRTCNFAESVNQTDEESENLHQQLLDREIDLAAFLQKYKKLRTTYHKRTLVHLAAKTSIIWALTYGIWKIIM